MNKLLINLTKNKFIRILIFVILSTLIIFPLLKPLLKPGIPFTYDGGIHQFRMAAFHAAIKDGHIPPRWSSFINYGWGSPVLNFNWSLPYWMSEPFLFAGWSLTDAQKVVVAMAIPLSYLTMFIFLYTWLGFWPALTGSGVSIWATFRIYLLYISGASGMEIGFIFWPLLFLAIILIVKKNYVSSFFIGSLSVGLTMISHQIMFLIIQPLFWSFAFIFHLKYKKSGVLIKSMLFFITGILLSAYFWFSAVFEKKHIWIEALKSYYLNEFISPIILFLQKGFFTLTGEDSWKHIYGTGWIFFIILGLTLLQIIIFLRNKWKNKYFSKDYFIYIIQVLFIGFFILSLYFITNYSGWAWKIIPFLSQFIYPIRFQTLALFSGSVLAAIFVYNLKSHLLWSLGIIILAIILNISLIPINPETTNWEDSYYCYGDSTGDMYGEFLPRTTNCRHFLDTPDRFERYEIGRIVEGSGTVSDFIKKSASASFTVQADTAVAVVFNQLIFPGWQIRANGKPVLIERYGHGEMIFYLDPGDYKIEAEFIDTPIRIFGNLLSFIGLFLFFSYPLFRKLLRRRLHFSFI